MSTPKRVLYVEAPWARYGSSLSLLSLIESLDPSRYQAFVAVHSGNPLTEDLDRLGIPYCRLEIQKTRLRPSKGKKEENSSKESLPYDSYSNAPLLNFVRYTRDLIQYHSAIKTIKDCIRRWNIDIIHLNNQPSTNRFAYYAAPKNLPMVQHVRGAPLTNTPHIRSLVKRVDRFICISEFVAHSARQVVGHLAPMDVVPNPVPEKFFRTIKRGAIREHLSLSADDVIFSQVARLIPLKGQDLVLKAFSKALMQLGPNDPVPRCVFIGTSEHGEGFGIKLKADVESLGLREHVFFIGYENQIEKLFADTDVLVHYTRDPEGFGRVIVEGMAQGCGVLVSDNGALPEIVEHGCTGFVTHSIDELSSAMVRVIRDKNLRLTISESAKVAARNYKEILIVRKVMDIYDQLFIDKYNK